MRKRLLEHAMAHKHEIKWKRILYALLYDASVRSVMTGKFH